MKLWQIFIASSSRWVAAACIMCQVFGVLSFSRSFQGVCNPLRLTELCWRLQYQALVNVIHFHYLFLEIDTFWKWIYNSFEVSVCRVSILKHNEPVTTSACESLAPVKITVMKLPWSDGVRDQEVQIRDLKQVRGFQEDSESLWAFEVRNFTLVNAPKQFLLM